MEPKLSPTSDTSAAFQFNKNDFIRNNKALACYYNKDATFRDLKEKYDAVSISATLFNTGINKSIFDVKYEYTIDRSLNDKIVDHGYIPYPDIELAYLLYYKIMSEHIEQLPTDEFDMTYIIEPNESTKKTSRRLAANRVGVSFQFSIEDFMNKNPALKSYENSEATFKEIYDMFIAAGYNGDRVVGMLDDKIIDKGYPPYPNAVFAFLLYYYIMEKPIEILQYVKDD